MPVLPRRFVVIVRAGEKSLHRRWLRGEGPRNWDLVVSWYGEEPYVPVADERVLVARGWKWDVLGMQFAAHPDLIEDYDYIFVPDDDIDADIARINRLFEIASAHQLEVSQPALSDRSYFSHLHTMRSRSFLLRYTNFVEVMAPCLSRAALRRSLPYLSATPSGYGLDYLWARFEDDNRFRAAIIDGAPMRHTRRVGKFLKVKMAESGRSQAADGRALVARFAMPWARTDFPCYAGIGKSGRRRGRLSTIFHMALDYAITSRRWPQRKRFWRHFRAVFSYALQPTRLDRLREVAPLAERSEIGREAGKPGGERRGRAPGQ